MTSTVARGKQLAGQVVATHPARAWQQYGTTRGSVLAGGVAYIGLFSVFSTLLVGFTVLGLVLGRRSGLQQPVLTAVDRQLPGLLDVGPDGGLVQPEALFADDVLSVTGFVALVVALVAGLGWLDATREGIRAMFGLGSDERPFARKKAMDVVTLATLGLAILASALVSVALNAAAAALLDAVGLDGGPVAAIVVRAVGVLAVLALDTAIFVILFRLLSGLQLPWRQVRTGALLGAVGLGLLKLFGGLLLGRVGGDNPLLATSAVLVGLLLWMNLVSRVVLLAAAWVATDAEAEPLPTPTAPGRAGPDLDVPAGPRDVMEPSFGQRTRDRTTLAAGAVLGALLLTSARVVAGAGRAVVDAVRPGPSED